MYKTIKPYIYIPQLNKTIKELIRTCKDCQQNKHSFKILDGYIESKRRLEDISSDIWVPLILTNKIKLGKVIELHLLISCQDVQKLNLLTILIQLLLQIHLKQNG